MKLIKNVTQLQEQCQLFLDCFSSQGGPTKTVTDTLAEEWDSIFCTSLSTATESITIPVPLSTTRKRLQGNLFDSPIEKVAKVSSHPTTGKQ